MTPPPPWARPGALLLAALLPLVSTPAPAQVAPAAPSARAEQAPASREGYRAGMTAVLQRNYDEAARILAKIPADHPYYGRAMATLAYEVYAQGLNRPKDGLPFIEKAYAAAPADNDVVRAYLRTHVLAGAWFDPKSLQRERRRTVAPEHAFLVTKPRFEDTSRVVPRAQLEADLDLVEQYLAHCFAYLEVNPVDYRGALDAIRLSLGDQTTVQAFEIQMLKLLSLFPDGHARTGRDKARILPKGYAPYAARDAGGRVVLIAPEQPAFLDPAHPYVTAIDGRPIADWLKVAGYLIMKESPQWHRRGALEMLAFVTYLRGELGLPHTPELTLNLESEDGKSRAERKVAVQDRPARRLEFPRGSTRRLGDIGYLRLSQMTSSERVLSDIDEAMGKFRDTRGLIIDVRGNLGGTKSILHTVFPYLMKPGEPMRILEMTCYRVPRPLPKPNPGGFAGSSMSGQTVGSSHWKTDAERRQVAEFIRNWKPAWVPPAGKFSEWHALGLDARDNPDAYYYDKPVIVLQDSATFSAGDIFVGALEDHPNVTQMGTATGGGNSQMESYRLPNSGVILVMGWSAKYRPNGQLYDGVGIPPDIEMPATARDLIGETDTVLDAARRRLSGSTPNN